MNSIKTLIISTRMGNNSKTLFDLARPPKYGINFSELAEVSMRVLLL